MKLKSLFVDASHIDSGFQGTHTFLVGMYTELSRQHPHIQLYFGSSNPSALEVTLKNIDNKIILPYQSKSRLVQGLSDAPRLLKKINPDMAHYQYVVPPGKKHCPYVLTIHDVLIYSHPELFTWGFRTPRKLLYQRSVKKSDVLTTVSTYSKTSIERYLKPSVKIWLTPNAVEPSTQSAAQKKEAKQRVTKKYQLKPRYILSVGRYEKRKNFELLIEAFQELNLADCDLVLAGSGVDRFQNHTIRAFNALPQDDLQDLYAGADLFVFPSSAEGFGIPPLEAVNALCPTVISNITALTEFEFLFHQQVDVTSKNALKQKISETLINCNLADLIQTREHMHKKYSWQKSAENLVHAIEDFLG